MPSFPVKIPPVQLSVPLTVNALLPLCSWSLFTHVFFVVFFFLMIRRPPRSPLFPSTPLFRSKEPRAPRHIEGPCVVEGRPLPAPQIAPAQARRPGVVDGPLPQLLDRNSTRLNSSH